MEPQPDDTYGPLDVEKFLFATEQASKLYSPLYPVIAVMVFTKNVVGKSFIPDKFVLVYGLN